VVGHGVEARDVQITAALPLYAGRGVEVGSAAGVDVGVCQLETTLPLCY
jgi:hypothetical protein